MEKNIEQVKVKKVYKYEGFTTIRISKDVKKLLDKNMIKGESYTYKIKDLISLL
jgi:hypothetical protein